MTSAAPMTPVAPIDPVAVAGPAAAPPTGPAALSGAPSAAAPVAAGDRTPAPSPDGGPDWGEVFRRWPAEIPKRGVVVTKLNEASPFRGFMINGEFVLFERSSPDALGARFLVLPCSEIATLKYTDPLKQSAFEAAGFRGTLSQ